MKRLICILLCAAMVLPFYGCATEDKPYTPTGDGLTWEEGYTGPTHMKEETPSTQELRLTYYPNVSMNPYTCSDFTNRALFSLIYQGLFAVDRGYTPAPLLCKSYKVSQDMKTYTFYPENARFSDGTTLTAADVAASLQAARESDVYGGRFTHISQINVTADGGVEIQLSTPYENLPLLLDIPIVKQTQVQAAQPLGTGPYMLDLGAAVLRRNTDWWCKANMVVTAPAITLTAATSATDIRDQFEFSGLSLVCADPGSDRYADYRCDYELWDCENNIFLYVGCNTESPIFSNTKIRSALTRAIDRDTLADSYYRGFARSATLPASPLSPYYSPVLASKYTYDGGAALTQAVTDARITAETPVVLLVNKEDSLRLRVARDIGDMLTACGLTVQMSELKTADYLKALKNKTYDLYVGQTKLSANMDLSAFFAEKGALRYGGMSDIAFYTLCTEALANHGNYYTLHQRVMEDGRLCPILFRSYAVYAVRGLLTGLTPARDSVFYYHTGRTLEDALLEE